MVEHRKPTPGEQSGLLIAKQECSVLARVLLGLSAPASVVLVRELSKQQVERDKGRDIPYAYAITDDKLNLGLRRLKRYGIADLRIEDG